MSDQTTLEQSESLRDVIENAVETVETPSEEKVASQEATEAPKTSRARDESGKFTKTQPEATTSDLELSDDFEAPDEPKIEVKPRPSSWKKDYEEDWGKLDPRIQDYIQQREADYAKGVSTYKNQWDMAAPVLEAIRPFESTLRQNNLNPAQWIQNLGNAHQTLVYGSPEQKVAMFQQLANEYGVNLGSVTGQTSYDPQFSSLTQELNQLRNQWSQFQAQQEQVEQTQLRSEIDSFKEDKPYFEEVREAMAGLLQSGMANDLQDAYDKAIRLNDDVFQRVNAEQAQKAEAAQREKVAAAKAKVLSPKSTTPTASATSGSKSATSSIRDAILNSMEQHAGGLI